MILDATLMTVLLGLAAYRITKVLTDDALLAPWREKHAIGIDGYRCADGEWREEFPENPDRCKHELSTERAFRDAVQRAGERPWLVSWASLLSTRAFWARVLSCGQCTSVWVAGILTALAVLMLAVATGNWTWLPWWFLMAPAAAGIAARMLFE